jgi:hypothetical protein
MLYLPPDSMGNTGVQFELEKNNIMVTLNHNGTEWEVIVMFADLETPARFTLDSVRGQILEKTVRKRVRKQG